MQLNQDFLQEVPVWLVLMLALLGGVTGEMWRADKEGAQGWHLLRRVLMRSGACMACGLAGTMLLYGAGLSLWSASALGCMTAMAGADLAVGIYERWLVKRLGLASGTRRKRLPERGD